MTANEVPPGQTAAGRGVATGVGSLVGGGFGYWAGYTFLVDQVGRIAHKIFWERSFSAFDVNRVLHSETFWQIAVPAAIGAVVGAVVARRIMS